MSVPAQADLAPDIEALADQYPEYLAALNHNRRWNWGINVLDSGTFALTKAALTETTVLPYFVSQLTSNALVIGLSPAIAWLGMYLPQLLGAYLVHSQARRKPYILTLAWLERAILLAMFVITLGAERLPAGVVLAAFLAAYFIYWALLGLIIPPYSEFYAKHIPVGRGRFLGMQTLLYGGVGVVGAAVVQRLLTSAPFPASFVHVFGFAFLSALPALIAFHNLREVPFPGQRPRQTLRAYLADIRPLLRANPAFVRFCLMRGVLVLGKISVPFLALYALQRFSLDPGTVAVYTGIMLAAQSAAAPIWGYLSDHWHAHRLWLVAALVQVAQAALAFAAPGPAWFYVVFALVGVTLSADATAHPQTTYGLSPAAETTRFIGLGNTFLGPLLALGPVVGGALVNSYSYRAALGASLVVAALGVAVVIGWIVWERRHPARMVTEG
ncbi:MAG: MFS transporter [Anaerolineales bacterium]|nr:MFS transporter [Anaerolineales bacterium]